MERRWLRGDLIEVLKGSRGYNKGDASKTFLRSVSRIEGEITRSRQKRGGLREIGRHWFSNTAVDEWNRLSNQAVSAMTMESLKH